MRIFVPFTHLRCETFIACQKYEATLVPLYDHQKDYGKYWARRWEEGLPFINCEQDVVPVSTALQEMWDCPHDYCRTDYRYPWAGSPVDVSPIGCAKFSAGFIAANRSLCFNGTHWHEPQYLILNASLNKAHVHQPASLHLHITPDWPLDARNQYGVPEAQDGYRILNYFA